MTPNIEIDVCVGNELEAETVKELLRLFDENYREANHDYLMASFDVLRFIALARCEGRLVGFAVGDSLKTALPRFDDPQAVALAGISCIDADYRRHGLFSRLAQASMAAGGAMDAARPILFCGRMAHPASYRAMTKISNNVVPSADVQINSWHREIIARVAELYHANIDPYTSRVIGKGRPIGYPLLDLEATPEEQVLFAPVDRDNGDSLLALSWQPESPLGWFD